MSLSEGVPLFKVFVAPTAGDALQDVLYSGYIAEGGKVEELTELVTDYIGNPRCVLMNSCTSALTIAYRISGVGPGDEVVTTPLTCIASNSPIIQLGARPVWADVDPATGMITAETIEPCLTSKTKAILVLHKEGDPVHMAPILELAHARGIKVIEDAAHAFGAKHAGKNVGCHGDFVCFSFQAIKHMTTGDGGALACADEDDYRRARKMKWLGVDKFAPTSSSPWEDDIAEWGLKANMNDLSAAIGVEQMKHIDFIIGAHHRNGMRYDANLRDVAGIGRVPRSSDDYSAFWAYSMQVDDPKGLAKCLADIGVSAQQIHPRNDVYSMFAASRTELPNTDVFAKREIALPCGWWMDESDVDQICERISDWL
jgi:perosamine synthetase